MTGRPRRGPSEPGRRCRSFDRLAPAAAAGLVVARIEAHTGAGDIVADLFGRGGWVARAGARPAAARRLPRVEPADAAARRGRPAAARRPPPRRGLPGHGRVAPPRVEPQGVARRPVRDPLRDVRPDARRRRGRLGSSTDESRSRRAPDRASATAARSVATSAAAADQREAAARCRRPRPGRGRRRGRGRPRASCATASRPSTARRTSSTSCSTCTRLASSSGSPRSSARIEGDLRAAPVARRAPPGVPPRDPAGQPADDGTRAGSATLRDRGGPCPAARRRHSGASATRGSPSRTASGWSAGSSSASRAARSGRSRHGSARTSGASGRGPRPRRSALAGPSALPGARRWTAGEPGRARRPPRIRLVLGQPPVRPGLERLGAAYHGDGVGARARGGALLPLERWPGRRCARRGAGRPRRSAGPSRPSRPHGPRRPRRAARRRRLARRSSSAVLGGRRRGLPPRDARGWPTPTTSAGSGRAAAARAPSCRPVRGPGRTSALPPVAGGAGDPDLVPGPGLFAAPERFDQRPFSALEAAATVSETAVEMLKARGEPARYERLLGEILVGLDRGGPCSGGYATTRPRARRRAGPGADAPSGEHVTGRREPARRATASPTRRDRVTEPAPRTAPVAPRVARAAGDDAPDPVERLIALIDGELARPTQHRLVEIEPGRWWLGDRADREAAAAPLADRVEWSVFSLLSTAGPLPESAFFERIAAMFTGHDLADEALVRACLESYRSPRARRNASSPPTTCCSAARSTPSCSPRSPTAATGSGCRSGSGAGNRPAGSTERRSATCSATASRMVPWPGSVARRRAARCRLHLVRPRQGRVPVRGRVDRDARRAPPAASRAHPGRRADRAVPRHRPGAHRAGPLQAGPLAAAAGGARRRPVAHPQERPPATVPRRGTSSISTPSSRCSASIRSSNEAASSCPCSRAEARARKRRPDYPTVP